jgi:hypothetical protein
MGSVPTIVFIIYVVGTMALLYVFMNKYTRDMMTMADKIKAENWGQYVSAGAPKGSARTFVVSDEYESDIERRKRGE